MPLQSSPAARAGHLRSARPRRCCPSADGQIASAGAQGVFHADRPGAQCGRLLRRRRRARGRAGVPRRVRPRPGSSRWSAGSATAGPTRPCGSSGSRDGADGCGTARAHRRRVDRRGAGRPTGAAVELEVDLAAIDDVKAAAASARCGGADVRDGRATWRSAGGVPSRSPSTRATRCSPARRRSASRLSWPLALTPGRSVRRWAGGSVERSRPPWSPPPAAARRGPGPRCR